MQTFAPAKTMKTERRKKVRNRPRSLVYVELESANGGMMRDLSEEGFALRAMLPLQAGHKTQFAFSLDGTSRISGEGRIAWIKEDGRVAGIEFCGITQSAREEIRGWLGEVERPVAQERRPEALGVSEVSTLEELRTEARRSLAQVATPKVKPVEVAPHREAEVTPGPVAKVAPLEERREEIRSEPLRIAIPPTKPVEAATPSEPEVAPAPIANVTPPEERLEEIHIGPPRIAIPSIKQVEATPPREQEIAPTPVVKVTPPEERREEVHASLPRMAIPTVKSAETVPEAVTVKSSAAVPETTLREEQQEERRFTLPRVLLTSVGSAGSAELAEVPVESVAAPSPEPQSEPRDVWEETAPVGVVEPLPAESTLEPLAEVEAESEFGERIEEPRWARFTLTKAIGIMVLLVLIGGTVVGHRQVGHALIWVGQAIAGDGTPPSHSLVNKPLEPTNQKPASALRDSSPAAPAGSVGATGDNGQQEYERAEEMLKDRKREAETGEAVQLLWLAAQKGNVNGMVTLAELYRRGRGVRKDCTQSRIFLSTAALKGSVEAREQLGKLAQEGCE